MKKIVLLSLTVMMLVGIVGCGANTPKEVLQNVVTNSNNMEAYGFNLDFSLSLDSDSSDPDVAYAANILNNLELSAHGKYDQKIERFEMILSATLDGDMKVTIDIPVIFVDNKLYVKVPNIPLFPIPEQIVGKYIELDSEVLEDESLMDQNLNLDIEVMQSLVLEILEVLLEDFGDSDFITELEGEDVPSAMEKIKHAIQLKVTDSTLEELVKTLIETTMPKILNILTKDEYVKAFDFDVREIEEVKSELSSVEVDEAFDELRETFVLGEASLILGVDQDEYISHQNMVLSGTIKDEVNVSFELKLNTEFYDINEEQLFELAIPTDDESLTIDQLVESFMWGFTDYDVGEDIYSEDVDLDWMDSDWEDVDLEDFDFENFDFENFDFENFDFGDLENELGL